MGTEGIERLEELIAFSAEAWREKRYSDMPRLISETFRAKPAEMSRYTVGLMLRAAGCPINYVPAIC